MISYSLHIKIIAYTTYLNYFNAIIYNYEINNWNYDITLIRSNSLWLIYELIN